ncbi:MAG: tetratricopeptide repeat protein [candidate division KSB1 bacterium]|nr:tetratricopeptide repeat protein [candidate division KSB1 bacterium]MDZ7274513.1 tetratricopeptide repeat protein [candidate division KSB1 bacterium]MDZ7284826.1 tetratricopeptide repeat protein [candidate division KSB1 bacterium]MDZ7297754.1 tetratricopeptide repeat protein [candidate division KSB1 bacterium]MDZ7308685.1 tetratricopeptide repeat protein [candidate division KSB1 bacterium]
MLRLSCFFGCGAVATGPDRGRREARHFGRNAVAGGVLALLFVFAAGAAADEAGSLFQQGNQYYQAGQYAEAAAAYEKIIALGRENWQVYYNLGNAYFKQRQPGLAILNYERALRLNRRHDDIRFNLELANLTIIDRLPQPPVPLLVAWLQAALDFLPIQQVALVGLIFWILLFAGLTVNLLTRRRAWQVAGRRVAWSAGACVLLLALLFAAQLYQQHSARYGIVLEKRVVVHTSPAADATEAFILHEGAKVQVQESNGSWARIRLADGKVGWLPQAAVGVI